MAIHKGKMHSAAANVAVNARKQKRKMLPVIVKTEPQMVKKIKIVREIF
jgi:hypothetical protein